MENSDLKPPNKWLASFSAFVVAWIVFIGIFLLGADIVLQVGELKLPAEKYQSLRFQYIPLVAGITSVVVAYRIFDNAFIPRRDLNGQVIGMHSIDWRDTLLFPALGGLFIALMPFLGAF